MSEVSHSHRAKDKQKKKMDIDIRHEGRSNFGTIVTKYAPKNQTQL